MTISRRRQWARRLFYIGPVVAWMALALALSTRLGKYDTSIRVLYTLFAYLAPDLPRPDTSSMYTMNYLARRSVYIFEYGVLILLVARALQYGAIRLRRRTVVIALIIGSLFSFADNLVRALTPKRHGGVDDLFMTLIGLSLFLGGIGIFFFIKDWERRLNTEETMVGVE